MEEIILAINESWRWLGPLQIICWGTALIALMVDIFRGTRQD